MDKNYITIMTLKDEQLATVYALLLEKNNIDFILEKEEREEESHEPENLPGEYIIKIPEDQRGKAEQLIVSQKELEEAEVSGLDNYLKDFSDQELKDVIYKRDEWNEKDVELAEEILKERGVNFSEEQKSEMFEQRIRDIRMPKRGTTVSLALGFIFVFTGGIIAIIIGWNFFAHTQIDPRGNPYYVYDSPTRKFGKLIFYLGILSVVIWIISLLWVFS